MAKEKRIVHFCRDSVFHRIIIDLYEAVAPGQNRYILVKEKGAYVSFKLEPEMEKLTKAEAKETLAQHEVAIFHSLSENNLWLAAQARDQQKVVWCSWGSDLGANHSYCSDETILDPKSYQANQQNRKAVLRAVKIILYKLLHQFPSLQAAYFNWRIAKEKQPLKEQALSKIDYVSTILPPEKEILSSLPQLKANYQWVNYGAVDMFVGDFYKKDTPLGQGMFVGHAAFFTCNHLDILPQIKALDYPYPIFIPMAYGNKYCKAALAEEAPKLFGQQLILQKEVLPKADYLKQLLACNIAVLNTKRQEALGTLITVLYLGMHTYLHPEGVLYKFCTEQGLKVYTTRALKKGMDFPKGKAKEMEHNRAQLEKIYGREVVLSRIENLLKKLLD